MRATPRRRRCYLLLPPVTPVDSPEANLLPTRGGEGTAGGAAAADSSATGSDNAVSERLTFLLLFPTAAAKSCLSDPIVELLRVPL